MSIESLGVTAAVLGVSVFCFLFNAGEGVYPAVFNVSLIPLAILVYVKGLRASILPIIALAACFLFFIFYSGIELISVIPAFFVIGSTPFALGAVRGISSDMKKRLSDRALRLEGEACDMEKKEISLRDTLKELDKTVSDIVNMYEMTRAMSAALLFSDAFKVLSGFLAKNFNFTECKLIIVKQQQARDAIDRVYKVEGGAVVEIPADATAPGMIDRDILDEVFKKKRTISWEDFVAIPLISQNRVIGILNVEGLDENALDRFLIVSRQFALQVERIRLYEAVQELAITDGLTEVYARRYFLERVREELGRSAKHGFKLSFLMIDLDHFKNCNDQFGHLVGDAVLKEIAGLIKRNIREIDLLGRYGGEEFSLLLPETDKNAAFLVAERLRYVVENHVFKAYDETISMTISVGISTVSDRVMTDAELIDTADKALYEAKAGGRNKVVMFKN